MMAVQDVAEDKEFPRIALRVWPWLYEDLEKCAARSGWDLSKQIRFELASIRGKAPTPYLPQSPSHDTPRRMKRA